MRTGRMHTNTIVHIARHVKTLADGMKLYAPACTGMRRSTVAYLGLDHADSLEAVTCRRCQQKTALYPSRYLGEQEVSSVHS